MKLIGAALEQLGVLRGLWRFLIRRAELRTEIEKERERNRAFAAHREGMQGDMELMDYEDHDGRKLWIRKHGTGDMSQGLPVAPAVIVGLGPAVIVPIPAVEDQRAAGELSP